jgi:hypothetical protein
MDAIEQIQTVFLIVAPFLTRKVPSQEAGLQIMSPHFERQPEKPVLVPKTKWYSPPAFAPEKKD